MARCERCHVNIGMQATRCPLCGQPIEGAESLPPAYPPPPEPHKTSWLYRWFALAAFVSIGVAVASNLLVPGGGLWCIPFAGTVLYVWALGVMTFNKRLHRGVKLMAHAIALMALVILYNMFANGERTAHQITWAVSYAIPFLLIAFSLYISFQMAFHKQDLRGYLLYQIALCVIGFVPLLLVLLGVATPIWPSIVAASCAYLTLMCLVIFARRVISLELSKTFHL